MRNPQATNTPQDRSRVNLDREDEMDFWSHQLGVSTETLRRTAAEVGPYLTDIAAQLHRHAL